MARETIVDGQPPDEGRARDAVLRPRWLEEVIGQKAVVQRLRILLNACKKLKRFTLIGATTRSGMLSSPMRDRFKMQEHLEFYSVAELAEIVRVNAKKLQTSITDDAALELARRSRGTPRIANNRLGWTRN